MHMQQNKWRKLLTRGCCGCLASAKVITPESAYHLCLTAAACRSVLYIQSMWRMTKQRRPYLAMRRSALTLQSHWRGRQARLEYAELVRRHQAATTLEAAVRGFLQRRRYRRTVAAAQSIQMAWRRWQVRGSCRPVGFAGWLCTAVAM